MNQSSSDAYFIDGGTLSASTPSYVHRPADDELFNALLKGEYCYVLTPRQMGKSSLMTRTSQRLKESNIQNVIVDLQGMGAKTDREFYASLLSRIQRGLKLSVDVEEWLTKKSSFGFGQMFSDFIQDIVLAEITDPIVIFLDEVDWMIKFDFRDDFFASIRSMYNARAQYPEFKRLSFALFGVASPADLISEPTRTPFNIGHAIPLQELSLEDAKPLQDGLEQVCPGEGKRILERIFYWTNGHPYLTQKLCKFIAESTKPEWSDTEVDELVERLFLSEESRKEANLKFIQDRILSNEQFAQMLKLYKRVRRTKVKENGQSILQNQLMLSGLLTTRNGYLEVRNRIYETVFNDKWINKNTPKNSQRIALITLGATLGIIILATLAIFINDTIVVPSKVNSSIADFISTNSSTQRLTDLANIYNQKGILPNTDSSLQAAQLFYGLSAKDQLALFTDYAIDSNLDLQDSLLTVIEHLYVTVADVDSTNDNTQLLKTMGDSLDKVSNNTDVPLLKKEIASWVNGRDQYRAGNYQVALVSYNSAIDFNSNNPATTYERAKVFIALKQYDKALLDLDTTINLAKQTTKQDEKDLTTPTITISETSVATSTNVIIEKTATPFLITPKSTSTSSPIIISTSSLPTVVPNTSIDRFKTNFTTFIDVVNAVRTLIDKNSALQDAIPANGDTTYTNLNSVGIIKAYARTATPVVSPVSGRPNGAEILQTATPIINLTQSTNFTPGSTIQHSVVDGEWLFQIARCYGADLNAVQNANSKITDVNASLTPNTIVTIPNIGSSGNIYGPPCITYYTVQSGDTWNSIAQKYNADIAVLQEANPGVTLANGVKVRVPLNSANGNPITPSNEAVRLNFPNGVGTVSQSGSVAQQNKVRYVLNAAQGQTMNIKLTAPVNEVALVVSAAANSSTLKAQDAAQTWSGIIPITGDYYIDVISVQTTTNKTFTLEVDLTMPTSAPTVSAIIPTDFPSPFINVRNYPDLNVTVVGAVQPGDQVFVTAYTYNTWIWYQISVPARKIANGWISGRIDINGVVYDSVVSSENIKPDALFISLSDIVKP